MPQMSPINWTIMFIVFILTLLVLISNIYFTNSLNYTLLPKQSSMSSLKNFSLPAHEWMW